MGINQIQLGDHGLQDYRFHPDLRAFDSDFRNIHATGSGIVRGTAGLANDAGTSRVHFRSVGADQDGFFPAHWTMDLYLRFNLRLAGFLPLTLVNRDPLEYETEVPMSGFPPLESPKMILKRDVDLHLGSPRGPRVATIKAGSPISPVVRVGVDLGVEDVSLSGDRFDSAFTIRPGTDFGSGTRVHYALVPTRGLELDVPATGVRRLGREARVAVRGRITDATEPHLGVAVRCWGQRGGRRFFTFEELELGDAHAESVSEGPTVVRSGDQVNVGISSDLALADDSEVFWIAPHGIVLQNSTGSSTSFRAPVVPYRQKSWLTIYTRSGGVTSEPHRHELIVEP